MNSNVDVVLNNDSPKKKKIQEMIIKYVRSGQPFPLVLETQLSKKFVKDYCAILSQIKTCKSLKADPTLETKDQLDGEVQKLLSLYKDFKKNFVEKYQFKCVDAGVLYLNVSAMMKEFKEDKKVALATSDALE